MRRVLALLAVVGIVAVVVIGLTQTGGNDPSAGPGYDLPEAKQRLQGAPAPLAELHTQASTLIGGGKDAFEARLAALKGHPVVINKWASWCAPCQAEFGVFESVGTERGKEVAFLGVNGTDKDPRRQALPGQALAPVPVLHGPARGHRAGDRGAEELPDHGVRRQARARRPTSTRGRTRATSSSKTTSTSTSRRSAGGPRRPDHGPEDDHRRRARGAPRQLAGARAARRDRPRAATRSCPGHEDQTTAELYRDGTPWRVRAFGNLYPALEPEARAPRSATPTPTCSPPSRPPARTR